MTSSEARKHEQVVRKLARRIRNLNAQLGSARARGQREARAVRERAAPVLAGMQATEEALRKALRQCAELGPAGLVRLDDLARGAGFWERLAWGLRFAFTGRVV